MGDIQSPQLSHPASRKANRSTPARRQAFVGEAFFVSEAFVREALALLATAGMNSPGAMQVQAPLL
jgi:hypothetical protein